jgi:hypothetical protein
VVGFAWEDLARWASTILTTDKLLAISPSILDKCLGFGGPEEFFETSLSLLLVSIRYRILGVSTIAPEIKRRTHVLLLGET